MQTGNWYFRRADAEHGPITTATLVSLVHSGSIGALDDVRAELTADALDAVQPADLAAPAAAIVWHPAAVAVSKISRDQRLGSGMAVRIILWVVAVLCLAIGIFYLANPSIGDSAYAGIAVVNTYRLTLGTVLTIVGAVFFNSALTYRP